MPQVSQEKRVILLIRNHEIRLSKGGESFALPPTAINGLAALARAPHVQQPLRYKGLGKDLRKTGEEAARILRHHLPWDESLTSQLLIISEFPLRQDLASIPWESLPGPTGVPIAYDPNVVVSHSHPRLRSTPPQDLGSGNLRVLILAPDTSRPLLHNKRKLSKLNSRKEIESLEQRLDLLAAESLSHMLVLGPTHIVSPSNIRRALENFRPHIVHYIGHSDVPPGAQESRFQLDHDHDHSMMLDERDLLVLLMQLRPMPGLILLNSCTSQGAPWSGGLPFRLQSLGIPHIITMKYKIEDPVGIAFATELYRQLAAGAAIGPAVQNARHHLALEERDFGDWLLPRLHSSRPDGPLLRVSGHRQEKMGRIVSALPVAPRRVPFKGLRPYDVADADIFLGRDQETADLFEAAVQNAWVVLQGESGSGKTSLLRAGLLPRLKQGGLTTAFIDVGAYQKTYHRVLGEAGNEESELKATIAANRHLPDEQVDVWLIDHVEHGWSIDPVLFQLLARKNKPGRVVIAVRQDQAANLRFELQKAGVEAPVEHTLSPLPSEIGPILRQFSESGIEVRFNLNELKPGYVSTPGDSTLAVGQGLAADNNQIQSSLQDIDLPGLSMLFRHLYLRHANTPGRVVDSQEIERDFPLSRLWLRELNQWLASLSPTTCADGKHLLAVLVGATLDSAEPDVSTHLLLELSGLEPERFAETLTLLERAYFLQWSALGQIHLRHSALGRAHLEPTSQTLAKAHRAQVILKTGLEMWSRSGVPMRPTLVRAVEEEMDHLELQSNELAFLLGSAALQRGDAWIQHLEALSLPQQREITNSLAGNGRADPRTAALTIAQVLPPHRRGPAPCQPSSSPSLRPWSRYASEIVLQSLWRENVVGEFNSSPRWLGQELELPEKAVNDHEVYERLPDQLGGNFEPSSNGWKGVRDAMSPVPKSGLVPTLILTVPFAAFYVDTTAHASELSHRDLVLLLVTFLVPAAALWSAGQATTFVRLAFDPAKPRRKILPFKALSARHGTLAMTAAIFGSMGAVSLSALKIFVDKFNQQAWPQIVADCSALLQLPEDTWPLLGEVVSELVKHSFDFLAAFVSLVFWGCASVPIFLLPILWMTASSDFLSSLWPSRQQWGGWRNTAAIFLVFTLGFWLFPTAVESSAYLLKLAQPFAFGESRLVGEGDLEAAIQGLFKVSESPWTAWLGALAPLIFAFTNRTLGDRRVRLRTPLLRPPLSDWGPRSLWPLIAEATPEATALTLEIVERRPQTRSPSSFDWLYCLAVGDDIVLEERRCLELREELSARARDLLHRFAWTDIDTHRYREDLAERLAGASFAESRVALENLATILDQLEEESDPAANSGTLGHQLRRSWRRFAVWRTTLFEERATDRRLQRYRRWFFALSLLTLLTLSIGHGALFLGGHLLDGLFPVQPPLGFSFLDFGPIWWIIEASLLYMGSAYLIYSPFYIWSKLFENDTQPSQGAQEHA